MSTRTARNRLGHGAGATGARRIPGCARLVPSAQVRRAEASGTRPTGEQHRIDRAHDKSFPMAIGHFRSARPASVPGVSRECPERSFCPGDPNEAIGQTRWFRWIAVADGFTCEVRGCWRKRRTHEGRRPTGWRGSKAWSFCAMTNGKWRARRDSNPRPLPSEGSTLSS